MPTLIDAIKQMFPSESDQSIQSDLSEVRQQHPDWDDATIFKNLLAYNQQKQVEMPTEQDAARYQQVRDYVAKTRGVSPEGGRGVIPMLAKGVAGAADAALLARDVKGGYMENLMKSEETQAKGLEDATEKELGRISGREKVLQLVNARGLAGAQKTGAKAAEEAPDTPTAIAYRDQLLTLDPEGSKKGLYEKMGKSDLLKAINAKAGVSKAESMASRADTAEKGQEFKETEEERKRLTSFTDKYNTDQQTQKGEQSISAANDVRNLANTNNPIAAASIPTFLARASGEVGALSEADKAPFGGSRSVVARLEAAVTQNATGKLTPENRRFVLELSQVMERSAQQKLDRTAWKHANQKAKDLGKTPEELYERVRPGRKPPAKAGGALADISIEEAPTDPVKRAEWRRARLERLQSEQGE
jgi:hypothetical protein